MDKINELIQSYLELEDIQITPARVAGIILDAVGTKVDLLPQLIKEILPTLRIRRRQIAEFLEQFQEEICCPEE